MGVFLCDQTCFWAEARQSSRAVKNTGLESDGPEFASQFIIGLLLIGCVTLGKLPYFSET